MSGSPNNISPKRPPITSSASSLSRPGPPVPSFQSFVKRTPPPPTPDRPLPPFPYFLRRASSSSIPQSQSSSSVAPRRASNSSSVYSRTVSQWGRDDVSWHSADFADEPVPPLPLLQPLAYSASTPQLVEKQVTPPLLESRTYRPLLSTPSPTASQVTTPGWVHDGRDVATPVDQAKPPPAAMNVLRTVPLDRAIAAVHAPGAVHLLPEEMRARTVARSRSHEPFRMPVLETASSAIPPRLPQPPVLIDPQGRQRSLRTPSEMLMSVNGYPFPTTPTGKKISSHAAQKSRAGSDAQDWATPRKGPERTPSVHTVDEPRGRTMQRGSRSKETNPYLSTNFTLGPKFEAALNADQYRALLPQPFRVPSASPGNAGKEVEDDNVQSDNTKLVPDPLFQSKPPARLPGDIDRVDHEKSASPYRLSESRDSQSPLTPGSRQTTFPSAFTMAQDSAHRRTSTSGSIPISPPTATVDSKWSAPPSSPLKPFKPARRKTNNNSARASAYYPHVAPRKPKASKIKTKPRSPVEEIPPMPFLSSTSSSSGGGSSSKRTQTTPASPKNLSPLRIVPAGDVLNDGYDSRKASDASSHLPQQPFHLRFAKSVAKYADLLSRTDFDVEGEEGQVEQGKEGEERKQYTPITAATVSANSPHLLPRPVHTNPKEIHLGWSDKAKSTFDKVLSPTTPTSTSINFSKRRKPSLKQSETSSSSAATGQQYTHILTPARPLDESIAGLRDGGGGGGGGAGMPRRKSSIFSTFVESWRENRAEKRREELKKTIRVIPSSPGMVMVNNGEVWSEEEQLRRSNSLAWM